MGHEEILADTTSLFPGLDGASGEVLTQGRLHTRHKNDLAFKPRIETSIGRATCDS